MNKWVECAMILVSARYPNPPYEYKFEVPEIRIPSELSAGANPVRVARPRPGRSADTLRPDISIWKSDALCAVVEVGELSRRDKLTLMERLLPEVAIWWIPKTDLIVAIDPDMHKFRFASDPRLIVGEKLLAQLMKERVELSGLTRLNRTGLNLIRDLMRAFQKTVDQFQLVKAEIDSALERAGTSFRLTDEELTLFLAKHVTPSPPTSDSSSPPSETQH